MKDQQERILCAAIHFDDGKTKHDMQPPNIDTGFVICGWRHPNCFATYRALCPLRTYAKQRVEAGIVELQGFITSTGRFVDRMVAAKIAQDAGQIDMKRIRSLMSEDLY